MAAALGSLVVSLEANMAKFSSDMGNARAIVEQSMSKVNSALDAAKNGVEGLSSAAKSMGMAFLGISAGAGMSQIKDQIDGVISSAAGLKHLSQMTGASVENLSALAGVARMSGSSMEMVQGSIIKLDKALMGADDASKGAGAALDFIGLKASDLKKMDPAQAMKAIADALNQFDDKGPGKAAIAMAIFGKTGAEALAMMKALAEQEGLSATMTKAQADEADKYEKSLVKLGAGKNALYKSIAFELLPAEQLFVDSLLGAKKGAGEAKSEIQTLIADGNLKQWGVDAAQSAASFVSGSVAAVKSLKDHKDAAEAVALAYGSWKISSWLAPVMIEAAKGIASNIALAASFFTTRFAAEAAAAKLAEEANAVLAAANMHVTMARATVLAAEGSERLALTIGTLNPALRAQSIAAAEAAVAMDAYAVASRAASAAGIAGGAASGVAGVAMSALGGPVGILTGLLLAGAGAWYLWGNKATDAAKQAEAAAGRVKAADDLLERLRVKKQFGTGDEGTLQAAMDVAQERISVLSQSKSAEAAKELDIQRKKVEEYQAAIYSLESMSPVAKKEDEKKKDAGLFEPKDPKGSKEQKDDVAKSLLEKAMKEQEAIIAGEKQMLADREQFLKIDYDTDVINAKAYYSSKQKLIVDELAATQAGYAKEIAALEAFKKSREKDGDRVAAQTRIDEVKAKSAAAEIAANKAIALSYVELEKEKQDIAKSFMLDAETEAKSFKKRTEALTAYIELELASTVEGNKLLEKEAKRHAEAMLRAEQSDRQKKIASDAFMLQNEKKFSSQVAGYWIAANATIMTTQQHTAKLTADAMAAAAHGVASSISQAIIYGKNLGESLKNVALSIADNFITAFIEIGIKKMLTDKIAAGAFALVIGAQSAAMVAMASLNAFASTAAIPIVGPFMAPEAAIAAGAAASVFAGAATAAASGSVASARGGWDVPDGNDPLAQLHRREMVLPEAQADVIRGLAKNPDNGPQQYAQNDGRGGSGGDTHNWHIHAMDATGVERVLRDHGPKFAREMRRQARNFSPTHA
jgi:hypothetical protein